MKLLDLKFFIRSLEGLWANAYNSIMKKTTFLAISTLLLQILTLQSSQAAIKLTVQYSIPFSYGDYANGVDSLSTCLVDSKCAADNKKKAAVILKKPTTKSAFTAGCKKQDESYLGSRIKVTSASGSTAGLGNLTSVVATNIRWDIEYANTLDWLGNEEDYYESEEDDPSYIEEGYEYVYFTADCLYSGTVTLVKSNAYTIYIAGSKGPEYSYAELAKKKWIVVLVDN